METSVVLCIITDTHGKKKCHFGSIPSVRFCCAGDFFSSLKKSKRGASTGEDLTCRSDLVVIQDFTLKE